MNNTTIAACEDTVLMPRSAGLVQGILSILIGLLLLTNPGATTVVIVQYIGIYWLITGIFSFVAIFIDKAMWGWKLFAGLLGIMAGLAILLNPLWSDVLLPTVLVVFLGVDGLIIGVISLIAAFQGGGWEDGILAGLSIVFGLLLLGSPLITAFALPFVYGIIGLVGGVAAVIAAFRRKKKNRFEGTMPEELLNSHKPDKVRTPMIVFIVFAAVFFLSACAQVGNWQDAKAVPAEQTIEQDVFMTGEQAIVKGTVNGDVFIVGTEVTITGDVNGSVFVLAEKLDMAGKVSGNLYVAAVEVNLPAESQIDRSLYAFVFSLITENESSIGRDLNLIAVSARLRGQALGKTAAIIGPWEIFKLLGNFFNQNIIGFNHNQPAVASLETEIIPTRSGIPHLASIIVIEDIVIEDDQDPSAQAEWALDALKSLINFIVVGGLALWILPDRFKGWASKVKNEPLTSAGYGVLVLINGYLVPVVGLFLLVGLLIGLLFLSMPSLAWTFFGLGMGVLVTLFTLFLAAITFISKAIVAYLIGTLILSKVNPAALKYDFLPLLLGLIIYVPLASIPYLGFVIGLVTTLLGLGAIWLGRKKFYQPENEVNEMKQF